MQDYEEDEEFFDSEAESTVVINNDDDDDDDPKGTAFMRGVEEAVKIRDADEEDEEF